MDKETTSQLNVKDNSSAKFTPAVMDKINQSLLEMTYNQNKFSLIITMLLASLIVVGIFKSTDVIKLWTWYVFFLVITVFRYILTIVYSRQPESEKNKSKWQNLFIIGTIFGGFIWGVAGAVLLPNQPGMDQTFIILMLAGVCAGSVPYLAAVLKAAIGYLIACLLPLIINLFLIPEGIPWTFDLAAIFFLIYLIVIAIKTHGILRNSISLQYENHYLLSHLSEAKFELEIINKKLEQAATHDPLTNVGNRNLFLLNLTAAIERAKASKQILALLYIDLDEFKRINDTHGHHVGDRLLLALVDRLEDIFRSNDTISRLGGDEFAIILENLQSPKDIAKVARRVCEAFSAPLLINNIDIRISASIGISIFPLDGEDPETLINIADKAMYHVKQQGGNNFRFNVELLGK